MRIPVSHNFHQIQSVRTGSSAYFIAYFNKPLTDLYSTLCYWIAEVTEDGNNRTCSTNGKCEICLQIFIKNLNYPKGLSLDKIIILILIVCKCNSGYKLPTNFLYY